MAVSVVSLADIEAMPFGRYEQWHRFLRNHIARLKVTAKALKR